MATLRFLVGAGEDGRKVYMPGTPDFVVIRPLSPQEELEIRDKCTHYERRGGQQIEKLDQVKQTRLLADRIIVSWGYDDDSGNQAGDTFSFPDGQRSCTLENKAEAMLRSSAFMNFVLDKAREFAGEEYARAETEGET